MTRVELPHMSWAVPKTYSDQLRTIEEIVRILSSKCDSFAKAYGGMDRESLEQTAEMLSRLLEATRKAIEILPKPYFVGGVPNPFRRNFDYC